MSQQSAFLEAAAAKISELGDQNQLNLGNQVEAAVYAIAASDVAHISSAIAALTADKIVEGTKISPEAILVPQVQEILLDVARGITPPTEDFVQS